jgi:glutamyl/glutaminyl-tRNA synthetase
MMPGRSLELSQARLALFSALWARSGGGQVLAANENPSAIDDLGWLGVEVDQLLGAPKSERYFATAEELIEKGLAYPCFCGPAEFREMQAIPAGNPESHRYDGRCRLLSEEDRKTLRRGGRHVSVRVIQPSSPGVVETLDGRRWEGLPDFDFQIVRDGHPTAAFAAVVDDHAVQATIGLVDEQQAQDLSLRALIARALGWALPAIALLPSWQGGAAHQPVGELRAQGLHPDALVRSLLSMGWDSEGVADLSALAQRFKLSQVSAVSGELDQQALRALSGEILRSLPRGQLVALLADHLSRRGFPINERESAWQHRFATTVLADLYTLSDAELLASLLLIPTVDYDKEMARTVRQPDTQALLDQFQRCLAQVREEDHDSWIEAVQVFRQMTPSPGRALVTLRMVLTGHRAGPSLGPVLALLGMEKCRHRLEKARRYAASP